MIHVLEWEGRDDEDVGKGSNWAMEVMYMYADFA